MSPKKRKQDFDNQRRIPFRAPSVDAKNQFLRMAELSGRSATKLAWHCYVLWLQTDEGKKYLSMAETQEVRKAA